MVVPCLNESRAVRHAHAEITAALAGIEDLEILLVDDGSTDDTLTQIKALAEADPRVRYLSLSRNFGLEAAQAAGFRYASKSWIAQLDCDLQNPPSEVRKLLATAAEGYDVVFGIRQARDDPWWRRWASTWQQLIARRILGIELPQGASTFRVMRAGVARTLVDMQIGHPYVIAMVPMVGARYACVPTEHRRRAGNRSRWRLSRLVGHGFELFIGYSWRPLALGYLAGALGALAAVVGAGLALAGLLAPAVTSATAILLAGLTLAALALVGRYLQRLMLDQRRSRPFYIREANLVVRPEDRVDGGEAPVPPPAPAGGWKLPGQRQTVLVLGASEDQLPLYVEANRRGLHTIAVDRSADRPALRYADEHLQISTRDPAGVVAALGDRRPAAVVAAASDASLASWHHLSSHYRTRFRYPRAASVASMDKAAFHAAAQTAGLTGYRWRHHADPEALVACSPEVGFPMVVKPTDSSGSKGVSLVRDPTQLPAALAYAARYTASGGLIIEEFLAGRNLTVDVFMSGGEPAFAAVTEKRMRSGPRLLLAGHSCPAPIDDQTRHRLVGSAARLCRAVGLTDGPADFDVILGADGEAYFLELNARLCGNGLPLLMRAAYGVDTVAALLSLVLGEPPELGRTRAGAGILQVLASPLTTDGVLSEVRGLAQVRALPGVARCELYAEPGATVHPFTQAGHKLGYLVVAGPDLSAAEATLADALEVLHVDVTPAGDPAAVEPVVEEAHSALA